MSTIIIPLPARDFDPTEVAIPWRVLTRRGHGVSFATPDGEPGQADVLMLTGEGLDPWGFVPGLRKLTLIGRVLRANHAARAAYAEMVEAENFRRPLRWDQVAEPAFRALVLPGGHRARGMRAYLESALLQQLVVAFFRSGKPVGAICHGVLLAARSIDPQTGRSVLFERKTTALTWRLERSAAALARVTRFWDPHYYRTYREHAGQAIGYASVEREVVRSLRAPSDFLDVPPEAANFDRKTSGLVRDSEHDQTPSWVVRDRNYVSARWPGDAHAFACGLASLIEQA
jgi:putative intracellular protease/amidase